MTRQNVIKTVKEAQAAGVDFARLSDQRRRAKDATELAASVLVADVGVDQTNSFLRKLEGLHETEAVFFGPEGQEKVRCKTASSVDTGYAISPIAGGTFAIRAVTAEGDRVAIQADFDACVVLAEALFEHMTMMDDAQLTRGACLRGKYEKLCEDIAANHLDLSGETSRIHRAAKYQADLTVKAHASAAEAIAEEKVERRVEEVVRKLATAAAMPAGLEKSLMLEQAQPLINKCFGGVSK